MENGNVLMKCSNIANIKRVKHTLHLIKDNTFILKVKGKYMIRFGGKLRRISVKVKGLYTETKDSMYFYVSPKNIKCDITPGKEDPRMYPQLPSNRYPSYMPKDVKRKIEDYDYYEKHIKSKITWDSREGHYDSELQVCDFQRIAIINQMLDFFECKKYSFKKIGQDSLRIVKKFVVTRPIQK